MKAFEIEKYVWTERDFDIMGWHDASVYAVAFLTDTNEFALDIDYIFDWVHPDVNETLFRFWVSPSTLVFENIHNFSFELGELYRPLQIQSVERSSPKEPSNARFLGRNLEWDWTIDLDFGGISFSSVGYKQFVRSPPVLLDKQNIEPDKRGDISFYRGLKEK